MSRTTTEDAYPFFSWFLFVNVPQRVQSGFEIVLVSEAGQRLATPVSLLERPDVFDTRDLNERDMSALAERLGRAVKHKERAALVLARSELEARFRTPDASYAVREFSYDPLEYFKDGAVVSTTELAEFIVGK